MDFISSYRKKIEEKLKMLSNFNIRKLGMMSTERQFKYYCKILKDKPFDRSEKYRIILDKCWSAILSYESLEEEVWDFQNSLHINNFDEAYYDDDFDVNMLDTICNNIEVIIEMLLDNNFTIFSSLTILLLNLDFICVYLSEQDEKMYNNDDACKDNILIINELDNQANDFKVVDSINTLEDVREWLKNCKSII